MKNRLPCAGDRPWSAWYGRPSCPTCLHILVTPRKFLQLRWDASPNPHFYRRGTRLRVCPAVSIQQSSGPFEHGSLHKTKDSLLKLHGGAPSSIRGKLFTGDPAQGRPLLASLTGSERGGGKHTQAPGLVPSPRRLGGHRLLLTSLTGSERRLRP